MRGLCAERRGEPLISFSNLISMEYSQRVFFSLHMDTWSLHLLYTLLTHDM